MKEFKLKDNKGEDVTIIIHDKQRNTNYSSDEAGFNKYYNENFSVKVSNMTFLNQKKRDQDQESVFNSPELIRGLHV